MSLNESLNVIKYTHSHKTSLAKKSLKIIKSSQNTKRNGNT